jgi:hypothetical protein
MHHYQMCYLYVGGRRGSYSLSEASRYRPRRRRQNEKNGSRITLAGVGHRVCVVCTLAYLSAVRRGSSSITTHFVEGAALRMYTLLKTGGRARE